MCEITFKHTWELPSGARVLKFHLSFDLRSYSICDSSEGSGETAQALMTLKLKSLCYKYQKLLHWNNYCQISFDMTSVNDQIINPYLDF